MELKKITESKKIMTILGIVVLLIIAMVSYTYSFFTVTVTDNDSIVGAAASLGVDLTVTKIAPSNDVGLVPQLDDYITKAVIGRKGNCVDDNGNNVCQVYQITVKNTSAASVTLDGTLQLNARDNPNLKWAVISGITEPTLISNINTPSERNLVREESYEANETKIYYIVLWISETNAQQFDTGDFTGVVTFKDSSSLYFTWVTTDIEGKTTVELDGEVFAYKISDLVPTQLEGATLTMIDNASGESEVITLTVEGESVIRIDEELIACEPGFYVVTTADYDLMDYGIIIFPEAGVYVFADLVNSGSDFTFTLDWTNGTELPGPAPDVEVETVTLNSVTLTTIEGVEYSMDGETWQDSPTFTGLSPNTSYTFYARYKATDTTVASEKDYVYVTTHKYDATETPSASDITAAEVTLNSITLNTIEGAQYSMNGTKWQNSPTFTGLEDSTAYTFYVRYKETNDTYASDSVSAKIATLFVVTSSNRDMIGYTDATAELVIPATFVDANGVEFIVGGIQKEAFSNCNKLTSVTIPDSVTSIGDWAFRGCTALTAFHVDENNPNYYDVKGVLYTKDMKTLIQYPVGKVDASFVVPDSVTTIEGFAFWNCINLTSVTFGENSQLTFIDRYAFSGCTALTDIAIPDSVTSIEDYAFSDCTNLTGVIFGENSQLETINDYAFNNCGSLTNITIPDSVTSIGDYAFSDCTNLTGVTFGENSQLETINYYAFNNCGSLTYITIPDSVTSIKDGAFFHCTSLVSVTFGKNSQLKTIGHQAFSGCKVLTDITIPDSVTSIIQFAFSGCDALIDIVIPDGVTSIGDNTFIDCDSLTSVTIPESVISIGRSVFFNCYRLTSITFEGTVEQWNAITFGKQWKVGVPATKVICSDGEVSLS